MKLRVTSYAMAQDERDGKKAPWTERHGQNVYFCRQFDEFFLLRKDQVTYVRSRDGPYMNTGRPYRVAPYQALDYLNR